MKKTDMRGKAGRVSGRATRLFKKGQSVEEKMRIAEAGEFSVLPIFNTLRMYYTPINRFNREIFPDEVSIDKLRIQIEQDIWIFFLKCFRSGDFKSINLFANAIKHLSLSGIGAIDPVKRDILMAYEYFCKNKKARPTKREFYDYFFDNLDYKKMHFEDFCHRADLLKLKLKASVRSCRRRG